MPFIWFKYIQGKLKVFVDPHYLYIETKDAPQPKLKNFQVCKPMNYLHPKLIFISLKVWFARMQMC